MIVNETVVPNYGHFSQNKKLLHDRCTTQTQDDIVERVEAGKVDDELALVFGAGLYRHRRGEHVGEFLFQTHDIARFFFFAVAWLIRYGMFSDYTHDQLFGLAYRHASGDKLIRQADLHGGIDRQ